MEKEWPKSTACDNGQTPGSIFTLWRLDTLLRPSLFWDVRRCDLAARRFETDHPSHRHGSNSQVFLHCLTPENEPIYCPEPSVTSNQSTPRNTPEEPRPHITQWWKPEALYVIFTATLELKTPHSGLSAYCNNW